MSEVDRYSNFRISREVEITPAIQRFHDSLQSIVARTFNAHGAGLDLRPVESLVDEGEPAVGRYTIARTEIPNAKVYPLNTWRYTHLEVLVRPDQLKLESQRRRLYSRSNELVAKVVATDDELLVTATQIAAETQTDYPSRGEELVLVIHPSRKDAIVVDEQNRLLHYAVRNSGPGSQLLGIYEPRPLTIALGHLPVASTVRGEPYDKRRRKLLVAAGLHMPLSTIVLCAATPGAQDAPRSKYLRPR